MSRLLEVVVTEHQQEVLDKKIVWVIPRQEVTRKNLNILQRVEAYTTTRRCKSRLNDIDAIQY